MDSIEKVWLIKHWKELKAKKRRDNSTILMRGYEDKYKCSECFHRLTKSCTDDLVFGCEYWYSPSAQESFGVGYEEEKETLFERKKKRRNSLRK